MISATFFRFLVRACASSVAIWIEPSGPVCQKYGIGQLRGQRVAGVHRRHLRRLRLHGHGLLLLRGRGERHAHDEHRALVDQLARHRRRDVGARLVVLDQQLDLPAEHAAAGVDHLRAEDQAFGAGLRIRLGDADPVGDDADLDGFLRRNTKQKKRQNDRQYLLSSPLLNRSDAAYPSILHKDRPPASGVPAAPGSSGSPP